MITFGDIVLPDICNPIITEITIDENGTYNCTIGEKVKNKYSRDIKGKPVPKRNMVRVDVYDVLKAFDVKCPALQHLIKKGLCAGLRGHKDITEDLDDIVKSAIRARELHEI